MFIFVELLANEALRGTELVDAVENPRRLLLFFLLGSSGWKLCDHRNSCY